MFSSSSVGAREWGEEGSSVSGRVRDRDLDLNLVGLDKTGTSGHQYIKTADTGRVCEPAKRGASVIVNGGERAPRPELQWAAV
jgi:hypothetical protein